MAKNIVEIRDMTVEFKKPRGSLLAVKLRPVLRLQRAF